MSKSHDSGTSDTANLGKCKEILLDGFDGDERAVLVLRLTKPLRIDGTLRTFAGIILENDRLAELAAALRTIAKRRVRTVSMYRGPNLVKRVPAIRGL